MNMTWKEFKDYVDDKIKEQGANEDIRIGYIDTSCPNINYNYSTPYISCFKNELDISNGI